MTRSHGTKLKILVSKLRSGTSKTKAGALFWKSHRATCSPVFLILYHVTGSCKGPITFNLVLEKNRLPDCAFFSCLSQELINTLLSVDQSKRITASEALKHPWIVV